jgi:orotidine-5'-phosphate decarboxylase
MSQHFADRLAAACRAKGNALCVGIDPRWDALPAEIRACHSDGTLTAMAAAYAHFSARLLDIVAPLVPVVKLQSAFFEACGAAGFLAQQQVLRWAREHGLIAILDNKRNDIASTAEAYADAAFAGALVNGIRVPVWEADALTVNPYLGRDAVEPFLVSARKVGGGVFVLVRTSNPGAGLFQDLESRGNPLYQHVAEAVGAWAKENLGACGYSDVGAVVGATHPAELAMLRRLIPQTIFLVPGYGAQGGSAADVAAAFRDDGLGAIVNSSRGIIASFKPEDPRWEEAIEKATRRAIADLRTATAMGKLDPRTV